MFAQTFSEAVLINLDNNSPSCRCSNRPLNPAVQGGGLQLALGFPNFGHAHDREKRPPGFRLKGRGHIDWQTTQGTYVKLYILI